MGSTSPDVTSAGGWVTPPVSYVDPTRRFCEFCGRPIARRFWQVEMEHGVAIFCDPAHAALYTTYPKSSRFGSENAD
jgi:hypothetical protein